MDENEKVINTAGDVVDQAEVADVENLMESLSLSFYAHGIPPPLASSAMLSLLNSMAHVHVQTGAPEAAEEIIKGAEMLIKGIRALLSTNTMPTGGSFVRH